MGNLVLVAVIAMETEERGRICRIGKAPNATCTCIQIAALALRVPSFLIKSPCPLSHLVHCSKRPTAMLDCRFAPAQSI